MAKQRSFKEGLQQLERVEGRAGTDTIRLWEGYREQAFLWRAIALLQIPATALSILAALIMYFFADTVIEVPPTPQPGYYSVKELPDSAFINVAQEVVNLIATYQPERIEMQYGLARKYLWEPALSAVQDFMNDEIPKIKTTRKSQIFFVVPNLTRVERRSDSVTVLLRGRRHKYIGRSKLEPDDLIYQVEMTTIPRNVSNEFGIVVVAVKVLSPGDSL